MAKSKSATGFIGLTAKDNPKDKIEVVIGDDKEPDVLLPQAKIQRWDNESNVSIRLSGMDSFSSYQDKETIVFGDEKRDVRLYELPTSADLSEGGFEFEVILKEKPLTNVVAFTLQDKDVEYFYQPPLTQKEIDEGASRPENVVGSYAVYAETPKTNWTGGKEYKCGKIGHIYRPRIIDAEGKEAWGELYIESGILTVTIPQEFLDKAVYPVRHAAGLTFGYDAAGVSGIHYHHDFIEGSKGVLTEAGTATSLTVYISMDVSGDSVPTKCAIYEKSDDSFVMGTEQINITSTSYSWVTYDLTSSASLAAGDYWLLNWGGTGSSDGWGRVKYDSVAWDSAGQIITYGTWPSTLSKTSYSNFRESIYATYAASGGGATGPTGWKSLLGVGQG